VLKAFLYWLYQKRWLMVAIVVGVVLYHAPYPDGIPRAGYRTLIICVIVIILILSEAVPLPAIALLIAVLQVTFVIAEPGEVAQSYMSDAVFFIMGSLMLAVAIVRQGLDSRITLGILTITGNRVVMIFWGFFVISLLLTSFMGQHTVAAMLLPVVLTLIRQTSDDETKAPGLTRMLLFAICYGCIIGSMGTPSGGARNAIMISYLSEFSEPRFSYLRWMIFAFPVMLIQIPVAGWVLSRTFKPEHAVLDTAVRRLKVRVAKSGPLTPQQILAIVLFGLIFLAWVFVSDRIGIGVVALGGVFLYLASGLVQWQDINQRTNWGVVLLFAAMISLGHQLRDTGAALWMADNLMQVFGPLIDKFAHVQYGIAIVTTTMVANIMSPSATVAVLGPIFMNLQQDPVTLGMATAVASGFGFFTAVGAPAAMIISATGLLHAKDFLKAGWRLCLVSMVFLSLAILFYWPHIL